MLASQMLRLRNGRCRMWLRTMHSEATLEWADGKDAWINSKTLADIVAYEERKSQPPKVISFLDRSKNMLSANWRCQLSTIPVNLTSDERVHVSLEQYGFFRKPYVCLPKGDKHAVNLLSDGNASIIVGHTDPPALMETIKLVKKIPPHVILSGIIAFAEDSEMDEVKQSIATVNSAAKEVIESAKSGLANIFKDSKHLLDSQFESRSTLLDPQNNYIVYLLRPRSCIYVDLGGEKHEVNLADGASVSSDPFSAVIPSIIEGMNQSEVRRFALRVFCAVERHVKVTDALLYSGDRYGFDILGRTEAKSEWKGFRFNFSHEVSDAPSFLRELVEMEKYCWESVTKSPTLSDLAMESLYHKFLS